MAWTVATPIRGGTSAISSSGSPRQPAEQVLHALARGRDDGQSVRPAALVEIGVHLIEGSCDRQNPACPPSRKGVFDVPGQVPPPPTSGKDSQGPLNFLLPVFGPERSCIARERVDDFFHYGVRLGVKRLSLRCCEGMVHLDDGQAVSIPVFSLSPGRYG